MDFPFESILGIPHLWKAPDSLMMFDVSVFFRTNKYCAFGLHLNWSTMPGELKPWGRLLGESPPRTDHENKGLSSLMSSV